MQGSREVEVGGIDDGSKQQTGVCLLALPRSLISLLFCFLPTETPFLILALKLIAIILSLAKTIKVAFSQLFLVNDRRDDFSKAGIAQG